MHSDERPIGSSRLHRRWLGPAHRYVCTLAAPLRASQRGRRRLVVGLLALLAAFPIVGIATDSMALVLVLFVPYIAGSVLLAGATGGLFDRPLASLDERQVNVRLNVIPEPYMTGASFGLVAGVVVATATQADGPMMMGVMLLAVLLLYALPTMVLAWRLPDEPDDGD